jgi:phosphatidylinositol glycan class B
MIGTLLGLSFLFRYQAGFMIAGFFGWLVFINKTNFKTIITVALSLVIMIGLGVLIDYWFYEEWTITTWNYFQQNILENKASGFGVEPWWYYFHIFLIQGIPPLSLILILTTLVFFIVKRKSIFTWTTVPFLLIHFVIGHKELRFLFPIILLFPYFLVEGLSLIQQHLFKRLLQNKISKFVLQLSLIANIAFILIALFRPADAQIGLYKKLYHQYPEEAILYHTGKNPFHRVKEINFYKRASLTIESIDSVPNKKAGSTQLIVFTNKNLPDGFAENHQLVYMSFPSWVKLFNINNWMKRSKSWYVYEL